MIDSERPRPAPSASPAASAGTSFRPDLEGLRGIAVVLVLLYHAAVPGFTGGFVGVDVFFVLSGFLITGILLRELRSTGRISLPQFYARRVRRILPAAALVLLVTVVASAVLLPWIRMPAVGGDAAAAALYVSNIRFAAQATDYLQSVLPPSPILHYWSLSVEEQFYALWPAFLALVAGSTFLAGKTLAGVRRVTIAVGSVFVVSLGLTVWLTAVNPPMAFFLLPTRMWELALGALLVLPFGQALIPRAAAQVAGWLGLGMIVAAGMVFGDSTPYPGTAALLPTIGSALVIAAGSHSSASTTGASAMLIPGRPLSTRPIRLLGRISYSLYLWHWPILVIPAAAFGGPLPAAARAALVVMAILLAYASQRWVEDPIRRGRIVGVRPRANVLAAVGATVIVALACFGTGAVVSTMRSATFGPPAGGSVLDVPQHATLATGAQAPSAAQANLPPTANGPIPADLAPALPDAASDLSATYYTAKCDAIECVFGDTTSNTTVVLFGDSHADQWFPALERLATKNGWRLVSLFKSSCPSVDLTVWSNPLKRPHTECDGWRAWAFDQIARERPALVVTSNLNSYTLAVGGNAVALTDHEDLWAAALDRTLKRLRAASGAVALIGDTPRPSVDVPICLSSHPADTLACATPFAVAANPVHMEVERVTASGAGVTFLDPTPAVCWTDPCAVIAGRLLIYRDASHLTATYARALAPLIGAALPAIVPR